MTYAADEYEFEPEPETEPLPLLIVQGEGFITRKDGTVVPFTISSEIE
jgi:hypothetical protein